MTDKKSGLKYTFLIIGSIVIMIFGFLLAAYDISQRTLTYKITDDYFADQRKCIEVVESDGVMQTKRICRDAITASGQDVVDDYVLVWTDKNLTTFSYFWKNSKGECYKAQAAGDYSVATQIILSQNKSDSVISAEYEKYVLSVHTTHNKK